MISDPDHYELGFISVAAARKVRGLSFFRSEVVEGGFLVVGAPIIGTYSKGPRKGRVKYDHTKDTQVIVTSEEVLNEEHRYERETGHCYRCLGSGSKFARWSSQNGTTYETCSRCNGTGKAAQ